MSKVATAQPTAEQPAAQLVPAKARFVVEDGVTFEDDDLVRRFLGLSVQCGVINGAPYYASLLDLFSLRTAGYAGPRSTYEVSRRSDPPFDYIEVRETIVQSDGAPMRGMPGYIRHGYYYDEGPGQFEYMSTAAEDPDFNQELLRYVTPPLASLQQFRLGACNIKFARERQRQTAG